MNNFLFTRWFIFALLQLGVVYSYAQKKIAFKLNIDEGTCFELIQTDYIASIAVMNGKNSESHGETNEKTKYWVEKKNIDYYTLGFMYTDYIMEKKGIMNQRLSAREADELNILDVSTIMSMVIDKPFFVRVSPEGVVLSVKENKAVRKELRKRTKDLSKELKENIYNMVDALSNKEAIAGKVETWSLYMPQKPVCLGETWTVSSDSNTVVKYTFAEETDSTYILRGVGVSKINVINIHGDITITNIGESKLKLSIEIDKKSFLPKSIAQESVGYTEAYIGEFNEGAKPSSSSTFEAKNIIEIKLCEK